MAVIPIRSLPVPLLFLYLNLWLKSSKRVLETVYASLHGISIRLTAAAPLLRAAAFRFGRDHMEARADVMSVIAESKASVTALAYLPGIAPRIPECIARLLKMLAARKIQKNALLL